MTLKRKLVRLKKIISGYRSCLVAFSGGVDSTFLLKIVSLVLPKDKILAVTAYSATYPKEELLSSGNIPKLLGVRHAIVKTAEFKDKRFVSNPINRCYFCKRELFSKMKNIAANFRLNFVVDGSSLSDKLDFRPGNKAKKEFNIRSPLAQAGLTKEDIRKLSKKLGLKTWNKPSQACLASRIPYGNRISLELLERINKAEVFLRGLGFNQVRLRHYNGLSRIEVPKKDISRLIYKGDQVVDKLKKLGYNYVTVDLEGYRTGSMNQVLRRVKV